MSEERISAVILYSANERAAITCARNLIARGVEVRFAFGENRPVPKAWLFGGAIRTALNRALRYRDTTEDEFRDSLKKIAEKIGPFVLMPSGERLLRFLLDRNQELEKAGVFFSLPGSQAYQLLSDKFTFQETLSEAGLSVPSMIPEIPSTFEHPYVVKARLGGAGKGILQIPYLVKNEKSHRELGERKLDRTAHFSQELVEGRSWYYCGIYDHGEKIDSYGQRNLCQQPGGKSIVEAMIESLPTDLTEKIDRMFEGMAWHGVMMMEFIESGGRFYGIECNPRLWGPIQLGVDNGHEIPWLYYLLSAGKPLPNTADLSRNNKVVGYRWKAGHQYAVAMAKQFHHAAFRDEASQAGARMRDVWLRRDTLLFGIKDLARSVLSRIKATFTG